MATAVRSSARPAHAPAREDFERLAGYPFVVVSWVDDDGYPMSVATGFETDTDAGLVHLDEPSGVAIPLDREVGVVGSHIRPKPGEGYDERRYLQLWGTVNVAGGWRLALTPGRAWGWDEADVPFFEYSERAVPQSRRYLARLSAEKGRPIKPRLALGWLLLRTTRLPFLSATAIPVLLGVAVAARHGSFDPWLALLTLIGGSLAHLGINVTNDVFDTLSGADEANVNPTQFSGGSRVAIYELLSVRQLAMLAAGLLAAAALIGLFLVAVTGSVELFAIGAIGIMIGIFYTAPPVRLVHRGVGEIAVALGFGPVMVLGAYVVQTGRLSLEASIASVPVAILVALILYVNEIPDRAGDAAVGKRTLPVRLSPPAVRTLYIAAAVLAFAVIVAGVAAGIMPWPTLVALAALPLALRVHRGIELHYDSPYTLMAVMGTNIKLHLAVGGLLVAGYVAAIVAGLLTG
jgi:1,4-dihydroxy-2-naphthoate polyprenyltransferase